MRILFLGTPAPAAFCLRKILQADLNVVGVVTRPDRPAGRKLRSTAPPAKEAAQELNIPVFQPRRVSDPQSIEHIRTLEPQIIIVVAYGEILSDEFLEIASEMGIVGLVVFLWIILTFLWQTIKFLWIAEDEYKRSILLGCWIGVLSILIHNLFSPTLRWTPVVVFFWFFMALFTIIRILINIISFATSFTHKLW